MRNNNYNNIGNIAKVYKKKQKDHLPTSKTYFVKIVIDKKWRKNRFTSNKGQNQSLQKQVIKRKIKLIVAIL